MEHFFLINVRNGTFIRIHSSTRSSQIIDDDATQIDEMIRLDKALNEEIKQSYGDADKMVFILSKRLALYEQFSVGLKNPMNKINLSNMKEGIAHDIVIWKIKKDTDEQLAQIISRIDQLEQKVDRIDHHGSPS